MAIAEPIIQVKPDSTGVSAMLARAFADDPVMAYIFPRPQERLIRIERIMRLALRTYHKSGLIESAAGQSAAVWQRPSPGKPSIFALVLNAIEAVITLRGDLDRAQQVQQMTAAVRIQQPHWYLAIIGTEPEFRGRQQGEASLASQLMQHAMYRCDQQQLPAYLESSSPDNLGFYRRFGFELYEVIALPGGPSMWAMIREPGANPV